MSVATKMDTEKKVLKPEETLQLAELFFFSYRAFIAQPDKILEQYDFGRAHHRVLHFVVRAPGMQVNELLEILGITKQSLARVLKQLIDTDFIEQTEGTNDRRVRLLYPTHKGRELIIELSKVQRRLILEALEKCPPETKLHVCKFLESMLPLQQKEVVESWKNKLISGTEDEPIL